MPDGQDGVGHYHARSGISHHPAHSSPHIRLIAVDGAAGAGGFVIMIRAFVNPLHGIGFQLPAILAQLPCCVMILPAVNFNHELNGFPFAVKAFLIRHISFFYLIISHNSFQQYSQLKPLPVMTSLPAWMAIPLPKVQDFTYSVLLKRRADQSSSIATCRTGRKPAAERASQPVSRLKSQWYFFDVPLG